MLLISCPALRRRLVLGMMVVAGLLPATLHADPPTPVANVIYRIEAKHSGRALWGNQYNSSSNIEVGQVDYSGDGRSTFTFVPLGDGFYNIIQQSRSLYLDTRNAARTPDLTHARLANPDGTAYQQWSLVDAGGGYVNIVNRQTGNEVTIDNGSLGNGTAALADVSADAGYDYQKFWIEEVRPAPVSCIAVSAGYGVKMPKRIVLCSNTNLGTTVAGTLTGPGGTTSAFTFSATQNIWGQYYYSYIDTTLAQTPGTYTVSVSGFPSQSFVVADSVYRAVPNTTGTAGVDNLENGFFVRQRLSNVANDPDPDENQTNIPLYLSTNSNGTRTLVKQSGTSGDLHGGWKDATSTDLEMGQNGTALRNLSYAVADAQNTTDQSQLLAEVAFDVDFVLRFQNSDGSWPISIKPSTDDPTGARKVLVNVDTGTASKCVLGLAAASRVLQNTDSTLAAKCLAAAQKGWTWIKANPNKYITDSTIYDSLGDWTGDADSVLGAITELVQTAPTTANQADFSTFFYDGQFNNSGVVTSRSNWVKRSGSYTRQTSGLFAAIALSRYLSHTSGQLYIDILNQLSSYFSITSAANTSAFGIDTGSLQSYRGQNERIFKQAYGFLNVYAALADANARSAALDQYNWVLGVNPFGSSFIINFGKLNVLSAFARARQQSLGELLSGPEVNGTTSITLVVSAAYNMSEGAVGPTTLVPACMMLLDKVNSHTPSIAGSIPTGIFSLKAVGNGRYVNTGTDSTLSASGISATTQALYTAVNLGSGYIALRSNTSGHYVTAGSAGTTGLSATATTTAQAEQFQWISLESGRIALKSLTSDRYVTAGTTTSSPPALKPSDTTVGNGDQFLVTAYGGVVKDPRRGF